MIPASYLFKDTYRQHWEQPEAPTVIHQRSAFLDGLATPLGGAIRAVFAHRPSARERHLGSHAYE